MTPSMKITSLDAKDIRFPTSLKSHGSDAMHPDPDYSCAYVTVYTDTAFRGYGLTFTLGRGTEIGPANLQLVKTKRNNTDQEFQISSVIHNPWSVGFLTDDGLCPKTLLLMISAIKALAPIVVGRQAADIFNDFAGYWRKLTSDSQLRWLGPEKGVMHLATAGILNALWDLWARIENKPLWKLLSDMSPELLVSTIDFRYITDTVSKEYAVSILRQNSEKEKREQDIKENGYPAYTTQVG